MNNEPKVHISPSLRQKSENNTFFHAPETQDLNDSSISKFYRPSNSELIGAYSSKNKTQNIDAYLSSIATGKKVGYSNDFSNYGYVNTVVQLEQLKDIINRGCNIISVKRLEEFFEVEFEEYELNDVEVNGKTR